MLLVTGPTGHVGAELVDLLDKGRAGPWRVVGRHSNDLRAQRPDLTAEIVAFDFFDRSTWSHALADVTSLFLLFPLPGNKAARRALVPFLAAAESAGVRHVVYLSVFGADRVRFIPHYQVEAALRTGGLNYTVLRCSFFMQNLHRAISTHGVDILEHGERFIPAGQGLTTFIDARDAAAVAALALQQPDQHRNVVHHLTGPEALSMTDVAEQLTDVLGYPVRYTNPNLIKFARRLRRRGVGWDTVGFMSAVYTLTRLGRNQPITTDVEDLLGRPPRGLADFLRDSSWRWHSQEWT
ncbi:NmrA family NAD(P)-binding protein [Mycobacterium sp. ITM-2016-00316]|uniref:NmrA family NAD(P)-binding protein n=1 Tax=Mycobacterium sp. ITM-2016-00316 TaxID=2099695 RepID=UPI000CFA6994|nr:NmrA family NAD(P)-binding protein [Mycobacterium sp. ITM-2016-00316]WNG82064.1 NmrA family NAD(P)-binding protein [Mycobacterium sp. ITM-2016-00316]